MIKNNMFAKAVKIAIVFFAAILMGFGVSMYYISGLGSDPISTFLEAMAHIVGVQEGTMSILFNLMVLIIYLLIKSKRKMINIGSVIQVLFVGTGINFGMSLWFRVLPKDIGFALGLGLSVTGAVLIGIALALYLGCSLGASPTDLLVLTVCDKIKKSYKWGFYIIYAVFFIVGIAIGGTSGLGTIIALVVTGFVADLLIPCFKSKIVQLAGE